MKYGKDDFGRKVYDIPNRRVYNIIDKLSDRLNSALEKAGFLRTASESDQYPDIVNESIRLLWLINNSLMTYNLYHQEYKGGHAYGERL